MRGGLDEPAPRLGCPIRTSLSGKVLFVTGATGFIGKVLVAKILIEQPDVGKIYLLIRQRGSVTAHDRLMQEVIASPLFWTTRQQKGQSFTNFMLDKLVAVPGDTTDGPLMGLTAAAYQKLQNEVDAVFNLAAHCHFKQEADAALRVNALAPKVVGEFAAGCSKQQIVLVHVSTAYVHGTDKSDIQEAELTWGQRPADAPGPAFDVDGLVTHLLHEGKEIRNGRGRPEAIRRRLEGVGMAKAKRCGYTNVYALTKALGEMLITRAVESSSHVQLVIMRPSIVESCIQDPFRCWNQGLGTTAPLIWLYGNGKVRSWVMAPNVVLDLVPCDLVVNALLVAFWRASCCCPGKAQVYHMASSTINPCVTQALIDASYASYRQHPSRKRDGRQLVMQAPGQSCPRVGAYMLRLWFRVKLPALLLSQLSWILAPLPWLAAPLRHHARTLHKGHGRLKELINLYKPYTTGTISFRADRLLELRQQMSAESLRHFDFDVSKIDWPAYLLDIHLPGLRIHVFHDCVKEEFANKGRSLEAMMAPCEL